MGKFFEDGDIAIGVEATRDSAARGRLDREALGSHGDFAVVTDAQGGLLAEDIRPPGAFWGWAKGGTIFFFCQVPSGFWSGVDLAMPFHFVAVKAKFLQQAVGVLKAVNAFSAHDRRQAFLPDLVGALDFTFGLVCGLHPRRTKQNGFSP